MIRFFVSFLTICFIVAGAVYYKVIFAPKKTIERLETAINAKIEKNLTVEEIRSQLLDYQQHPSLPQLKQKHECRLHWLTSVLAVLQQHKMVLTRGFKDCLGSDIYTDQEKESLQTALTQFHDGVKDVYVGEDCLKADIPALINLASQENKKIIVISSLLPPPAPLPTVEALVSLPPQTKADFIKKLKASYMIDSLQECPREVMRSALLSYIDRKFIIAPGSNGCFDDKGPPADFIKQAREFVLAASNRKPSAKFGAQNITITEDNLLKLSGFQESDAKK